MNSPPKKNASSCTKARNPLLVVNTTILSKMALLRVVVAMPRFIDLMINLIPDVVGPVLTMTFQMQCVEKLMQMDNALRFYVKIVMLI